MTLEQLICLYREQSFDNGTPPFCSNELLTIYANEAQDEACRRGDLLRDSSSAVCTIAFAADDESVAIDPRIIEIQRAKVNGRVVALSNLDEMEDELPNWDEDTRRDVPQRLIQGVTTGRLFLWPRPAASGTIRLTVRRLPLDPMVSEVDEPEIRSELHTSLVEWMLFRAYSREETEMYNDTKAALCKSRFVAEFGSKASGRNEAWARNGGHVNAPPIA
jgi:hypothetical protein